MKNIYLLCLLLTSFFGVNAQNYSVNFEGAGETKIAYGSGSVTLSGLSWNMTESLIGTEIADFKNGVRSARMRGYGTSSMTMLENKPNGIGTISFLYRRYGTDSQVAWVVEYSIDNGQTWTQAGDAFTATNSNDPQTFQATVNNVVNGRIRIRTQVNSGTSNRRMNVDDIVITDFTEAGASPFLSVNPLSISGLDYLLAQGPSNSNTIEVSGLNLENITGNISVEAPENFEVSINNTVFSDELFLPYLESTLSSQTLHVRLKSGLSVGNYSGTIVISGGGAPNVEVSVSGSVSAPFSVPYSNNFRTQANLDAASALGFSYTNGVIFGGTAGGGYTRMPNMSSITTPEFELAGLEFLEVSFSVTTFGGNSGQVLSVLFSDDNGVSYQTIGSVNVPASYTNFSQFINLSSFSGTNGKIKFEMTAGTNQIRFRDLDISLYSLPSAEMSATSCGVEYVFLPYEFLNAVNVPLATQYEFKLESGLYSQTALSNNGSIRVFDFADYQYGTTYDISVRYLVSGVWSDFSPSCQISTVAEPITEVQFIPCGSTLSNINTNIYFKAVVGSSMYHYEVTNTSTNDVQTLNLSTRFFRISMLDNFSYSTTYSVRARVTFDGVLMPFGPSCNLSTPNISTELRPVSCGAVIPNQNALIHARGVVGANLYDFEITNTVDNTVLTVQSSTPNFSLSQMSTQPVLGIVYSVRVRASVNNVFGAYGNACTVSVALPSTKLRPSSCNAFLPNNNTPIYANSVLNATGYEFEITHPVTEVVEIVSRPTRVFSLGMMSTAVTPNTTYSIRVRATVNGQLTQFGDICTVTTPMEVQQISRIAESVVDASTFEVNAFPNPFSNDLTLSFSNKYSENIVEIFDLTGKLIFNRTINTTHFKVGSELNAGVYLIRVTNGNESKTLKVVKK